MAATTKPWDQLRAPFSEQEIGHLPRSICRDCARSERKRCDRHQWVSRCDVCNGSHTSATMHISYVGHADVTARLLAVDPEWTWEPMAIDPSTGMPVLDRSGGLWIRLTVLGVTRPGYGDTTGTGGVKEAIGDALRNAAMRFGVALDLWAKGDRDWAKAEKDGTDRHPDEAQPKPDTSDRDPQAAARDALLDEVATAAQTAGVPLGEISQQWADSHNGEHIQTTTDLDGLRTMRDLLAAGNTKGDAA